jgi:hypothetical protein
MNAFLDLATPAIVLLVGVIVALVVMEPPSKPRPPYGGAA